MDDNKKGENTDTGRCSRGVFLGDAFAQMIPGSSSLEVRERRDDISIAILTGGESRRMGDDKALLELAGKPLVEHVIEAMKPLSDDVFLVGNDIESYRRFGLPVCSDLQDTRSSLVGVYSAIAASRRESCLVVSCDMPFADPALAGMMAGVATGYDAVVPISPAGIEPLFALYKRSCLDTMADFIKREELKIINVLERLNVHWVAPADMRGLRDPSLTFFNVNTPEELAQAEGMLSAIGEEARGSRDTQEPPLVCFVGNKDSGKTTFLEKLVAHLTALGLRVACIKHDSHGFQMDHEGTDTWRLAEAGARRVVISSPERLAMIARDDMEADLGELTDLVGASVDIILAEGYKRSDGDKIEVQGNGAAELVCPEEELLAVISDETPRGVSLPVFDRSNAEPVAEFIIERYGLKSIIAEEGH